MFKQYYYWLYIIAICVVKVVWTSLLFLQGKLFEKIKLHDTCGINNLHGMPGVISALASVVLCAIATEDMYGAR